MVFYAFLLAAELLFICKLAATLLEESKGSCKKGGVDHELKMLILKRKSKKQLEAGVFFLMGYWKYPKIVIYLP